ncbi:MAG: aminotransferase class V-fold PLP-dependent enzyme [Sphingobacteriaceae bacterium]
MIINQSHLFNIPPEITYLNCAGISPQLNSVTMAGEAAIKKKSYPWSMSSKEWLEDPETLRKLAAEVMQVADKNVALIPSASYGVALAAKNVPIQKGQSIVLLEQQYPSNVYDWINLAGQVSAKIETVKRAQGQGWTAQIIDAINGDTAIVAVPHCHWIDGSFIDLEIVSKKAKSVGAALVIDASQSLGALPIDIGVIKPDFLISVGYKWLMGPYTQGYLYADEKYHERGRPLEYSWLNRQGGDEFAALVNYKGEYKVGARRFDYGESPSFIHVPMAISALQQILDWGVGNINEALKNLTNQISAEALRCGFTVPPNPLGHFIGIQLPTEMINHLRKKLEEEQVYVSFRGGGIRIAPHLYNDLADIQKLFSIIKSC